MSLGIFSVVPSDRTMCPEVDSASENEYQGFLLGLRRPVRLVWRPTTPVVPNVEMIRDINLPGTPRATSACRGTPLPLLLLLLLYYIVNTSGVMVQYVSLYLVSIFIAGLMINCA